MFAIHGNKSSSDLIIMEFSCLMFKRILLFMLLLSILFRPFYSLKLFCIGGGGGKNNLMLQNIALL